MADDFETHMLRIEEAMAEYAVALCAYGEWMDNWRRRQPRTAPKEISADDRVQHAKGAREVEHED